MFSPARPPPLQLHETSHVLRVHYSKVLREATAGLVTCSQAAPLEPVAGTDGDHGEANALQLLAVKHQSSAACQPLFSPPESA
jgi:hypothetical protein